MSRHIPSLRHRTLATAALAVAAITVPLTATAHATPATTSSATRNTALAPLHPLHPHPPISTAFALPGDRAYPESITADSRTGDLYISSYVTGAIYKATPGHHTAQVFLPSGTDGRTTANGVKVDRSGRLWVINSTTGVAVYDLHTRHLIARFDATGTTKFFINDLAITPDGTAYLTDSSRGIIYRVTPHQLARAATTHDHRGALAPAYDLSSALPKDPTAVYTLNGIAAAPSGRYLLTVDMTAGTLYRVDIASGAIRQVTLRGGDLRDGDGLEIHGSTLWATHNRSNTLTRWRLSDDGTTAHLERRLTDESLQTPTSIVHSRGRTYVTRSQFTKGGPMGQGTPQTPFTVATVNGI
ncbi:SMP-30/gluconolactonase/LRE family protein [Streptomyces sp. GS7]|uniref:SMP-30/gluconolactonase/LRE family protein n=1 Tax=Streptomyces sp. GS7 TaxID=2692234 RepID=UPI0013180E9A|nr:SMP-30/gluconolactonase/LRE family protein [Streptomyces sp. GS7]QHC26318.1 superoxide dismutase [Streptomyces sp. GS7]